MNCCQFQKSLLSYLTVEKTENDRNEESLKRIKNNLYKYVLLNNMEYEYE